MSGSSVRSTSASSASRLAVDRHDPRHPARSLRGIIPVIAPVANGADGQTYNINADTMAGAIAAATGASRLFLLTDVAGVLDKQGELVAEASPADIAKLKADGAITGGMIPKIDTCVAAVQSGVDAAVILDGRVPHAILLEIFTTTAGVGHAGSADRPVALAHHCRIPRHALNAAHLAIGRKRDDRRVDRHPPNPAAAGADVDRDRPGDPVLAGRLQCGQHLQ